MDGVFSETEIRIRLQEIRDLASKKAAFDLEYGELNPRWILFEKRRHLREKLKESAVHLSQLSATSPIRKDLERERVDLLLQLEQVSGKIPENLDEESFRIRFQEVCLRREELDLQMQSCRRVLIEDRKARQK